MSQNKALPTVVDVLRACPLIECPECHGAGKVKDREDIGFQLRKLRLAKGLSLRKTAKAMGISAPFLSDLELGQRGWSIHHMANFLKAIQ